jgi:hypothetical protein
MDDKKRGLKQGACSTHRNNPCNFQDKVCSLPAKSSLIHSAQHKNKTEKIKSATGVASERSRLHNNTRLAKKPAVGTERKIQEL